ncbi:MFS transporter [Marinilongibacter aquaticus]|uniref:MFS transporter n=1 Tax=Marinilongibacter aquaticus TaxID=2975157 RepID=UPI0021BD144D|nr:MFS transporter [Marinilongibacter aquaticus]UBM59393.1 MFS transporter [Marinilongibacter aquaticus]
MNGKGFQNIFRALQYPNYRLFISGQAISRIGTWMERTGVNWVVYEMTHSPLMLGLTVFASQFPSFLFSLYGGIVADRYDRHKVVLMTQIASMIQAIVLAVIVLLGHAQVWHILVLTTILGVINAFDIPVRQTLVHQMVDDPADIPNAVALNSSIVNIARLLGPALSGIVLSTLGAGVCFSINALSYLAVIVSLLFLKLKPQEMQLKKKGNWREVLAGINYLKGHKQLAPLTVYMALLSLLVLPYNTLLPEFAKQVFHGGAETYGYITSCIGSGALIGTIFLASVKDDRRQIKILLINAVILGLSLIAFAFSQLLPVALLIAVVCGFTGLTQSTICLTIIQTRSDPAMRGRMISLYAMALFGMLPLGSLLLGAVSHQIGSAFAVAIQGLISIVIATVFYRVFRKQNTTKVPELVEESQG